MQIFKDFNTTLYEDDFLRRRSYFNESNAISVPDFFQLFKIEDICFYSSEQWKLHSLKNGIGLFIPLVGNFLLNKTLLSKPNEISCFPLQILKPFVCQSLDNTPCYGILLGIETQKEIMTTRTPVTLGSNTMNTIFMLSDVCSLYLGLYDLRKEDQFLCSPSQRLFALVVSGAFEINNRLVESGEAIAFLSEDHIEFEALSDKALLLIIELTKQQS